MHSIAALASAKINLMLHVTGREPSGFHALQSLFAFTGLSDKVIMTPSHQEEIKITGLFSPAVMPEQNSLLTALHWFYGKFPEHKRPWSLSLEKNIPVAAGLGGGTSDAAAVIALLCQLHKIVFDDLPSFIKASGELGADVPVCLAYQLGLGSLFWLQGSGKDQYPQPLKGSLSHPVLLINPLKPTYTKDVFHQFGQSYAKPIQAYDGDEDLLQWVGRYRNDLQEAAVHLVPEIRHVLDVLAALPGCVLSRMSGTGATCFALFEKSHDLSKLAQDLSSQHPHWWIFPTILL